MKNTALIYSLVSAALLCGCDDSVEPVDFAVSVPAGLEIEAGEPVRFVFGGNPDYITFFSGENGCDYAASDRQYADIDGLELSCAMRQQYNDLEYIGRQLIYVYVSSDFSGDYNAEAINNATWIPLTGGGANSMPVPVANSAQAVSCSGKINLGEYTGTENSFYIAFLYNAPGRTAVPTSNGGGRYKVRPRIDITDLQLIKTLDDGSKRILDNASTGFGFRPVYEDSYLSKNYQVNDDGMLFQPAEAKPDPLTGREPDERVWMVSTLINPRKVEPDLGLAIKSVEARLDTYEYIYTVPGTYTATFVATNANLWDSKRSVQQLTVNVR